MKKYKVWAYQGFAWLKDLGVFDSFDEAQDALMKECEEYSQDPDYPENYESNEEIFLFSSTIREVE